LGVVAAAGAASGTVLADDDTGAWYVSPMLQYNLLDNKRAAKDGLGFDVALGYNIAPHFAAEFNGSNGSYQIHNMASQHLTAYSLDGLYKILPGSIVDPYAIVGAGEMDDSVGRSTVKNQAWMAEAGVGALTNIGPQTGSFRLQLRTEAKYRREFIQNTAYNPNNPGDVLFGVGLQFEFGAPVPPPVVAAAPPPPEPEPPPPPPPPPAPLDSDHDGVPDSIDKCPNTPLGDKVDSVGCTLKDEIKLQGVNFATDSADLVPESHFVLDYAVDTLKKYPHMVVEVRGHTDNRGSKKHNQQLSERRAESVEEYLKAHGVTNTMTAKGYGEELPIADNKTPEGRLENRRVTLHIVGP
jgi:OOP family OmpA-OmpF porin